MTANFLLVHSPIVGPDTWEPVAEELRGRGHDVFVAVLPKQVSREFWRCHVEAVTAAVARDVPGHTAVTMVAHSGAGQLLAPAAAALPPHRVEAYILADAGLPTRGRSRLQQLREEAPVFADELEAVFAAGGRFPQWPEELLAALVPDARRRSRLAGGVRQLPRSYWAEPIPDNPAWPDAPVGVLLFSAGYLPTAAAAREAGWPLRDLQAANHFLAIADPVTVAEHLLGLRAEVTDRG